jgi:hypothetical protein
MATGLGLATSASFEASFLQRSTGNIYRNRSGVIMIIQLSKLIQELERVSIGSILMASKPVSISNRSGDSASNKAAAASGGRVNLKFSFSVLISPCCTQLVCIQT